MDVCLLSQRETARFENYRIQPRHDEHTHIQCDVAVEGVSQEDYRVVDTQRPAVTITTQDREWKSRMSGGFNVRQMVRG